MTAGLPAARAENPGGERPIIAPLTGIRALAVTWAVLQHFEEALFDLLPGLRFADPIVGSGFLGPEIFFILSGFILSYNWSDSVRGRGALRRFWWARIARIYPVHLATLAAMGILVVGAAIARVPLNSADRNTVVNFVGNVFMLQALPGFHAINGPAWSLSCDVIAYLAFPPLVIWIAKQNRTRALIMAIVLLLVGVGVILSIKQQGVFWMWSVSYPVIWTRIVCEFPVGILLWAWWRHHRGWRYWDFVGICCFVVTLAICFHNGPDSPRSFVALPLIALFVLSCASATGILRRVLSSTLLQWGGRISYSLYLTHYIVFLLVKKLLGWERFVGAPLAERILVVVVWSAIMAVVAAACYYAVEEPGRRLMRRVAGRRARKQQAAEVGSQILVEG